ncbi:hypothetical protein PUNSTDRAFT_55398 [Punctularia strigosozonata HHB-11173 SS5]|uniref:Uncharacterized protein n=1 Tax=Punctularia strigosozonata (strain HHB-11173) TaxID=741275 RepID=R7S5I4_PUNST|nr:uncharacterized protein PUNSTDRAFT_55398 [Punctularia strigosozonata HHB-11173 SS5]EIN04676.1 hypothetical protein PUNSTDRAFT_55398 [Punctularia strigosozonata HHB-11173 SS5]
MRIAVALSRIITRWMHMISKSIQISGHKTRLPTRANATDRVSNDRLMNSPGPDSDVRKEKI